MAATRARQDDAESKLTDRQRYWLKHLRTAERRGEPLATYAARLGLSKSSLYEAKRRLRILRIVEPAPKKRAPAKRSASKPTFVEVHATPSPVSSPTWRARLPNGVLIEGCGDLSQAIDSLGRL